MFCIRESLIEQRLPLSIVERPHAEGVLKDRQAVFVGSNGVVDGKFSRRNGTIANDGIRSSD
jgi:hypothetical protein